MGNIIHRIDIECIGHNAKGLVWRVAHEGMVILEKARTPAFDACRLLLASGKIGKCPSARTPIAVPRGRVLWPSEESRVPRPP